MIKTFRTIEEAVNYLVNSPMLVNQFFPALRELEERHGVQYNGEILLIDENGILD
jgi:hypothetical protein